MIIQYTEQGYWLASGYYRGRPVVAEGETRGEAATAWIDHVAGIDDDGHLGTFPFATSSAAPPKALPVVCAWCRKVYNGRQWVETNELPAFPVSHGICNSCEARVKW